MSRSNCTPKLRKRRHPTRLESAPCLDHPQPCPSLTDRLNTASGRTLLDVNQILNELFPVHANFVDAQRLLSPPRLETAAQGTNYRSCRTTNKNQQVRRVSVTTPLRSIQAVNLVENIESTMRNSKPASKDQRNHICTIWEDKFRRNELTVEDSFYLVLHDDLMNVLEDASLLRETQLTFAQAMEIEVTLDAMKRSQTIDYQPNLSRIIPSVVKCVPLCMLVTKNVLNRGEAFRSRDIRLMYFEDPLALETSPISPASPKSPKHLLRAIKHSAPGTMEPQVCPTSVIQHGKTRLSTISYGQICHLKEQCGRMKSIMLSPRIQVIKSDHSHGNRYIMSEVGEWLRENCVQEMIQSQIAVAQRKRFGAEKITVLLARAIQCMLHHRMKRWYQFAHRKCYMDRITAYCRFKCVLQILRRSRLHLKSMALNSWKQWSEDVGNQQYSEKIAAVVTIQAWVRQSLAKHRVAGYLVNRSAVMIQALWRGFFCRKMLTRARRYRLFNSAAWMIQHSYRAYVCRCLFVIKLRRHRAALIITRNLRRYCAKRRMFRAWCRRVARFHSAVVIQIWMRSTVTRIRRAKARRAKHGSAALILQRFFRYTRFLLTFDGRVQRLILKKAAAAVMLQKAYRTKIARARFYALKDQLEEQVRQRVLRDMWNNFYASNIQRWWRHLHKQRLLKKSSFRCQ